MPIIKSAKKRVRQNKVKRARNIRLKKSIRGATQDFETALAKGTKAEITKAQSKLSSLLDTATKKNVFHKNKVARRKKSISKKVKDKLPATKTVKKTTVAKTKKSTPKK